jgi:hypothetical protein
LRSPWSALLQAIAAALIQEQIPPQWEALWEGCPDIPADYCRAALRRATAIERFWYAPSQSPGGLLAAKQPLDLSQLFRPGALLNALRQAAARLSGVPLDGLRLATSCDPRKLPGGSAALVVQLGGLMLQGASFNGTQLQPVEAVSWDRGGACTNGSYVALVSIYRVCVSHLMRQGAGQTQVASLAFLGWCFFVRCRLWICKLSAF